MSPSSLLCSADKYNKTHRQYDTAVIAPQPQRRRTPSPKELLLLLLPLWSMIEREERKIAEMKKILENSRSQYGLKVVPGSCFGALLYSTLETGAILLPSVAPSISPSNY